MLLGLVLVAVGAVYLLKPTIFRRGIWLKTSIAIRTLSDDNYIRYMRILGVILMVFGLGLIVRAALH
ncbi:hypothetical protein [Bradyrhizobium sp. URHC0002]